MGVTTNGTATLINPRAKKTRTAIFKCDFARGSLMLGLDCSHAIVRGRLLQVGP